MCLASPDFTKTDSVSILFKPFPSAVSAMLSVDSTPTNATATSLPSTPLKTGGRLVVGRSVAAGGARVRFLASTVSIDGLRPNVRSFVEENAKVLQPDQIHVCDGSEEENQQLLRKLQDDGRLIKLKKYENW